MIARILLPLLLLIILPACYFEWQSWEQRQKWYRRLLRWLIVAVMVWLTIDMACEADYFPDDLTRLTGYLALLAIVAVPQFLVALFSLIGRLCKRRQLLERLGVLVALLSIVVFFLGRAGFANQLEVRHQKLSFADLPAAFDGYRIVLFSDAHVGTLNAFGQDYLRQAVDSINTQHPDLVIFAGDLLNKRYGEVEPCREVLSSVKARDGVISVLGNHDYAEYISQKDPYDVAEQLGRSVGAHAELGWHLLRNGWQPIQRDSSRIVIAGMENDGEGRFPQLGDISRTLQGVSLDDFVVMVEHDPTAWRRKILPHCHAQLTLSGHTHGGQFSLFGWSPASLVYRECEGLYQVAGRMLYVTKGLGGVIPFRLGAPGEIVVITLNSQP